MPAKIHLPLITNQFYLLTFNSKLQALQAFISKKNPRHLSAQGFLLLDELSNLMNF